MKQKMSSTNGILFYHSTVAVLFIHIFNTHLKIVKNYTAYFTTNTIHKLKGVPFLPKTNPISKNELKTQ